MLAGRWEQAISIGSRALEIAGALNLDEIRAIALNNVGSARVYSGDSAGIADLESALEIASAINSPEAARVMNNLADALSGLGETQRARQLWRDGLNRAQELGNTSVARFIRGVMPFLDFADGNWDQAVASMDEFIAEAEMTGGHVQVAMLRELRGRVRFARGDTTGAMEDAELALAAGRRMGDPQSLAPTLSFMAWMRVAAGHPHEAGILVDELLQQVSIAQFVHVELALALDGLGRHAALIELIGNSGPSRWAEVLELIADGSLQNAADVCEQLGSRPSVAYLRMHEAERLIRDGQAAHARAQLAQAMDFWRSVRATRFLDETEALMARLESASPGAEDSVEPGVGLASPSSAEHRSPVPGPDR